MKRDGKKTPEMDPAGGRLFALAALGLILLAGFVSAQSDPASPESEPEFSFPVVADQAWWGGYDEAGQKVASYTESFRKQANGFVLTRSIEYGTNRRRGFLVKSTEVFKLNRDGDLSSVEGATQSEFRESVEGHRENDVLHLRIKTEPGRAWRRRQKVPSNLRDRFRIKAWIRSRPAVGASREELVFDPVVNRVYPQRLKVKGRFDQIVLGIPSVVTEVEYQRLDWDESPVKETAWFDEQGRRLEFTLTEGEVIRFSMEPRRFGKERSKACASPLRGVSQLSQKLGDPRRIEGLELVFRNDVRKFLEGRSGQVIEEHSKEGYFRVKTGPGVDQSLALDESDRTRHERALRSDKRYAKRLKELKALLAKAGVHEKLTADERIRGVIDFLHGHMSFEASYTRWNLRQIMKERRGSSREISLLFCSLARQLGLTARPIRGLVYGGDRWRGLVVHTWCEVAIDGRWEPVDPTWGEVRAGPGHLSCGHLATRDTILGSIVNDRFEVELTKVLRRD